MFTRAIRRCLFCLLLSLPACGAITAVPPAPRRSELAQAVVEPSPLPSATQPAASPRASQAATPTLVPTRPVSPSTTPSPTPQPAASATTAPTASPTLEPTAAPPASPATGELTFARGAIDQRPWMVMIDNHPNAYPQSGLDRAAVVFEGLAEYGVTRFVALYGDGVTPDASEIGPVRSTRLYFAQWAMGFHPVYAYAGGSPDGIALAQTTDQLISFDALSELNESYVWRDMVRAAPHNLYTSSAMLRRFAGDKAVQSLGDSENGYLFDSVAPGDVEAATIDYYFLDRSSRAGFRYDAVSNGYHRVMRGVPHLDRLTNEQLWTRNVVVMQVSEAARQNDPQQRIDQQVVGSGEARVFMAGRSLQASWRKDAEGSPLRFYNASGQELVFNTGPVWIAAIPSFDRLTVE